MEIEKITYSELFPTGSYLNCRIEISGSVDEEETPLEALQKAKRLVHEFHKQQHPQMYDADMPIYKGESDLPVIQYRDR